MAGTIVVDAIQSGSGASATGDEVAYGSAKAWVNFNGSGTVAIRDSFNVSSITDNGTGLYSVNFTDSMPNANFCPVTAGRRTSATYQDSVVSIHTGTALTTSLVNVGCTNGAGGAEDFDYVCVAILCD